MSQLRFFTAVGIASLTLAGLASAATPPAAPAAPAAKPAAAKPAGPNDRAQIMALKRRLNDGFVAKDAKKVMSFYARDGLFVFDVTPPRQHVGWADYKKDWEALFAAFPGPLSNEVTELSVTVAGDVAYGHDVEPGHYTAASGAKTDLTVRVTDVYRKIGGRWLIVQEHVSVPVDLATMKPDPLSKP
jgi:uncharacterized protein (TIGR02246 family)